MSFRTIQNLTLFLKNNYYKKNAPQTEKTEITESTGSLKLHSVDSYWQIMMLASIGIFSFFNLSALSAQIMDRIFSVFLQKHQKPIGPAFPR